MRIVIVTPVFNDWESFARLSHEIAAVLKETGCDYEIVAVNDDSSISPDPGSFAPHCHVLNLTCNLGHQRAIAVGLAWATENLESDAVVVMDADGEDKPADIRGLLTAFEQHPDSIIVARRDQRTEGPAFRLGYQLYQWLFRLFTGRRLQFGNFCLIPFESARRIVFHESLWNHLPATVLRSRFPIVMLPTARGVRYAGQSRMNLGNLVLLGFSAISVYSDVALLRTLLVSGIFGLIALAGIVVSVYLRVFTEMAIPGWTSSVVGSMTIIVIQCLVFSVFLLFVVLSSRSQQGFVVARHYHDYVMGVETP